MAHMGFRVRGLGFRLQGLGFPFRAHGDSKNRCWPNWGIRGN